ncbi:uncharacterized protein [Primulina huaijiensis]|uniref:uncharacterized protein n=1 Tax=Primulina huaijiensis TaxID=1492673 RepID=UPI003CC776AB
MILKKRNAMLNYMRRDVADLLKNGLDINAYGRADGLLVELNRSSCYEFIEKSSLQVLNHLVVMNKQRECPEDCKEAVSSLMFAAARFADLPELRELRTLFLENYGDSMNSYANKEFVQKLKSGGSPSKDMNLQLLQDIASEYGLQWNSKDLRNKLRNEPAAEKSIGTKRIEEDKCSLRDENTSNSVEKTGPGGAEHECKNLREVDVPKRRNNLSNYGHEEATKIEDKVSSKREDVTSRRGSNNVPQTLKTSDKGSPVKDIRVHTEARSHEADGSESVKRVVLEVENHENRPQNVKAEKRENTAIKYNSVPDHIKHEVTDKNFHLCTREKQKDDDRTGLIEKANAVPKSVRTRHVKRPPIHENASNSCKRDHSKVNFENAGEGRRILKFLDEGCNNQEDEKMMDELLLHYSKKKGPQDPRKSSSNISTTDSSDATKRSRDGPNRTTSLPNETLRPVETPKVHTRASSLEPQILEAKEQEHGHVHPKLPEYDDFVARLASLRGRV